MRKSAFALLGALSLGVGALLGNTPAQAGGYDYDEYDEGPATVVTRKTIIERRVIAPPPRVVREMVVRPPIFYRPRPVVREVVVERDGFYGPRRFGPGPVRYGYGPGFDPYD